MGVVKKVFSPSPAPQPISAPMAQLVPQIVEGTREAGDSAGGATVRGRQRPRVSRRRGGGGVRILFSEAGNQEPQGPKNVLGVGQTM